MSVLIISFLGIIGLAFVAWHFLLSIYEVRYVYDFDPQKLIPNQEYIIKCEGINSFGGVVQWRELGFTIDIKKGEDNIVYKFKSPNQYHFKIITKGNGAIELGSKFAINPTILSVSTIE